MSAVCCQVEVSATGPSFFKGSPTDCGVCECDLETSTIKKGLDTLGLSIHEKKYYWMYLRYVTALKILAI